MNECNRKNCPTVNCLSENSTIFRTVIIPAAMGDETGPMKPTTGAYKNTIVEYQASGAVFLYDTDGIYTSLKGGVVSVNGKTGRVQLIASDVNAPSKTEFAAGIQEAKNYADTKIAQSADTKVDIDSASNAKWFAEHTTQVSGQYLADLEGATQSQYTAYFNAIEQIVSIGDVADKRVPLNQTEYAQYVAGHTYDAMHFYIPSEGKMLTVVLGTTAVFTYKPLSDFMNYDEVTQLAGSLISVHNTSNTAHPDIRTDVSTINGKIPAQASTTNQLADKNFVNSSISTNTAMFKGTYNTLEELEAQTATNNDYGFVVTTDTAGNTIYNRYKYNGTAWLFEYALNNSSFTAAQWAAIESGITAAGVTKLNSIEAGAEANVIDAVQANGVDLPVDANKKVNIPVANDAAVGVVKTGDAVAISADAATGLLSADAKTYAEYSGASNNMFVSKGTLENVVVGKGIVSSQEANKIKVLSRSEYEALATKDIDTLYFVKGE